jgi:dimeric dUTPase (all-alpha-NTP-PPase superfamily)
LLAVPSVGAAKALFCIMPKAESTSTDITKKFLMLFLVIASFLLVNLLSRAYIGVSFMDNFISNID